MKTLASLRNARGNALLAAFIIGLLAMSGMVLMSRFVTVQANTSVRQGIRQRALSVAQNGVSLALAEIRRPGFVGVGTVTTVSSKVNGDRYDQTLSRTSQDSGLVDAWTTAYCLTPTGPVVDPVTTQRAHIAVIHTQFRIVSVSDYFAAVPGVLQIAYGSDLSGGSVYGGSLIFQARGINPIVNPTRINKAFYSTDVTNDVSPDVVFAVGQVQHAQQLTTPIRFPNMDATMRAYYVEKASATPQQMLDPALPFSGSRLPPSGSVPHVYFSPGDLNLGEPGNPIVVNGVFVIYVQGTAYIHSNITLADTSSWIGILTEQDIRIADDAPNDLTLNGTFVTNGAIIAEGAPKHNLTFNGGFIAHSNANFSSVYQGVRQYSYGPDMPAAGDPELLLPNTSSILESQIIKGRFN